MVELLEDIVVGHTKSMCSGHAVLALGATSRLASQVAVELAELGVQGCLPKNADQPQFVEFLAGLCYEAGMKRTLIVMFVFVTAFVACGGKKNAPKTGGDTTGSAMGSDMSGHDMGSGDTGSGSGDMGSAHPDDGHAH